MKKYSVLFLICFVVFIIQGNVFASTIESDPLASYGYLGFADSNGYTLGQSFHVDTPYTVNTLDSITTWIGPDFDGAVFNFNVYNASDTTASLFNTQFTLNSEYNLQQVSITGISLSLDNVTDYIFTYTLTNGYIDPTYGTPWSASMAGTPIDFTTMTAPDLYVPGQEFLGSPSGGLYPASSMWQPFSIDLDLKFQAELSHESASVPEPATIFLLGLGILGLTGINRKKIS